MLPRVTPNTCGFSLLHMKLVAFILAAVWVLAQILACEWMRRNLKPPNLLMAAIRYQYGIWLLILLQYIWPVADLILGAYSLIGGLAMLGVLNRHLSKSDNKKV